MSATNDQEKTIEVAAALASLMQAATHICNMALVQLEMYLANSKHCKYTPKITKQSDPADVYDAIIITTHKIMALDPSLFDSMSKINQAALTALMAANEFEKMIEGKRFMKGEFEKMAIEFLKSPSIENAMKLMNRDL